MSKNDARKGIKTKEGLEMAKKRFHLDEEDADINKDGEVSSYERERGEAVQKVAMDKELYGGGLMDSMGCGCGDPVCECGMMGMVVGHDEVSGNPIPVGSTAENVRDDIPAALSTGEYVLPADVVKWHGLKHIQGMMDEAKMGLMSMHMEGQIHDIIEEEEPDSKESKDSGKSKDEDSSAKKGKKDSEEEIETPEGNVVEVVESVVEELRPSGHAIAIKQKPKVKVYKP